jgi:hypothetical protein
VDQGRRRARRAPGSVVADPWMPPGHLLGQVPDLVIDVIGRLGPGHVRCRSRNGKVWSDCCVEAQDAWLSRSRHGRVSPRMPAAEDVPCPCSARSLCLTIAARSDAISRAAQGSSSGGRRLRMAPSKAWPALRLWPDPRSNLVVEVFARCSDARFRLLMDPGGSRPGTRRAGERRCSALNPTYRGLESLASLVQTGREGYGLRAAPRRPPSCRPGARQTPPCPHGRERLLTERMVWPLTLVPTRTWRRRARSAG